MTPAQAVLYYLGHLPAPGPAHVDDLIAAATEARKRKEDGEVAVAAVMLALCHHLSVRQIETATGWPKTTVHRLARDAATSQLAAANAAIERAESDAD